MAKDNENVAKKLAKLVTEGPESYRKKYEGLTEDEIADKITREIDEKMHRADNAREERYRDRDAKREERLREHMEKWNREDWNKPIFLRRAAGGHHVFWRVFWGVLFLAAAGLVIATSFGWLNLFVMNIWWLILMIFLAVITIASLINLQWFGVFFPIAGILTVLNYQTDWFNWSGTAIGGIFATALLLSIAFSILFHHNYKKRYEKWVGEHGDDFAKTVSGQDDGDEVYVSANLGEAVRYVESQHLQKVFVNCSLGGAKVYFANAKLADNQLEINIRASLGGVELYVPKNWKVVNNMNALAGGISEKNFANVDESSPIVTLRGSANLGGVEIIYV